jgi:hypothetical protein
VAASLRQALEDAQVALQGERGLTASLRRELADAQASLGDAQQRVTVFEQQLSAANQAREQEQAERDGDAS